MSEKRLDMPEITYRTVQVDGEWRAQTVYRGLGIKDTTITWSLDDLEAHIEQLRFTMQKVREAE